MILRILLPVVLVGALVGAPPQLSGGRPGAAAQGPSPTASLTPTPSPTPTSEPSPVLMTPPAPAITGDLVVDCFAECPGAVPDTGGNASRSGNSQVVAVVALLAGGLALAAGASSALWLRRRP